jgi:type IV pilus assembly protein PilQ
MKGMPVTMHTPSRLDSLALLLLFVLLAGCAANKEQSHDPFFEKWKVIAEQSLGHSPSPASNADAAVTAVEPSAATAPVPVSRALPIQPVTLKMHNSSIPVVLQALARAAGQSIMVKSGVEGQVSIHVENKPWDQLFEALLKTNGLTYVWEGDLLRVMTLKDMEHDLQIQEVRKRFQTVEPLVTHIVKIRYADARSLQAGMERLLTRGTDNNARGSVVVDEHTNSLIIQSTEKDVLNVLRMIDRLDQPRAQIKLKAHIIETTSETARNLGIQWGGVFKADSFGSQNLWLAPGGSSGSTGDDPQSGAYTPVFGSGISGQGFGVNFPTEGAMSGGVNTPGASLGLLFGTIGGNILEAQLSALERENMLNILSSPSITTLDNQTASTESGERVPFIATDEDGNIEVKFEDAVLKLEITPHIIDHENMKLKIFVQKNEVDITRTVLGNPFIIKKQTETTLITRTGETVVISGLTKQRRSDGEAGVPLLKDVPGLGRLFKSTTKRNDLEEVLIFITPHILPQWRVGEVQKTEREVEEDLAASVRAGSGATK